MTHARRRLMEQPKEDLADLLVKMADENEEVERRVMAQIARRTKAAPPLEPFEEAFDGAVWGGDEYVNAEKSFEWMRGVEEVLESYEELLRDGHAKAVIQLAEKALESMESRAESVNDSYGHVGDVVRRLVGLHHQACLLMRPDPKGLARWLFDWKNRSKWCILDEAPTPYEDVLDKQGLEFYASLTVQPKEQSGCPCGHLPGHGWYPDEM